MENCTWSTPLPPPRLSGPDSVFWFEKQTRLHALLGTNTVTRARLTE